jgi:predicted transcriptional regulator
VSWTFLTNHGQVLLCIARSPDMRMREIAASVGITERAAQRIVSDLVEAGYVTRRRVGRRNEYTVDSTARMRHPLAGNHDVGELLSVLADPVN